MTARLGMPASTRFAAGLFASILLIVAAAFIVQAAIAGTGNVVLTKATNASNPAAPGDSYQYTIDAVVGDMNADNLVVKDTGIDYPQVAVTGATYAINGGGTTPCTVDATSNVNCPAGNVATGGTVHVVIDAAVNSNVDIACLNPNGSGTLDDTARNTSAATWDDTDGAGQSSASNTVTVHLDCTGSSLPTPTPSMSPTASPTATATPTSTPAPSSTPAPTASPSPSNPFTDIGSSIFKNDILFIYDRGITHGCTASTYCPNGTVLRDQMASFLARALNLPAPHKDYFSDDNGNIHEDNINRLAEAGITVGCSPTKYCPKGAVLRDQMASFLTRAYHLAPSTNNFFADDNGDKHEANINALAASGITGGCGPNRYCPSGKVTRGQMAAFLHRAILH